MRILHVITGLGTGGAETQLRLLVRHSRHAADVVTLHNPGAVAGQLQDDGVRVVDVGMRGNRDLRALGVLFRLIRSGRYDVVHTHLYRACIYGRLAARLAGAPRIVATEHSLVGGHVEGRRVTAGVRALYLASERLGDCTIAVSEAVRAELVRLGVPDRRLTTIPNGVDLAALQFDAGARAQARRNWGIPASAIVIGAVGRLHPDKRFDEVVEAAAPLLGPHRSLVIVGDGSERAGLESRVEGLGVAPWVVFAGERPAAPLLSAMDVLVTLSRETFGLTAVEALANGLPVVYRDSPALDDLRGDELPAVRVGPSTDSAREALRVQGVRRQSDACVPRALADLDVREVARRVDDLYERLPGRR